MKQAKKKITKKKQPSCVVPPCEWKNCEWVEIPSDPYYPTRAFKCGLCLSIRYNNYE